MKKSQESLAESMESSVVHEKPKRGLFKKMISNNSLVDKRGSNVYLNAMDAMNLKKKENRGSVAGSEAGSVMDQPKKKFGLFKKKESEVSLTDIGVNLTVTQANTEVRS